MVVRHRPLDVNLALVNGELLLRRFLERQVRGISVHKVDEGEVFDLTYSLNLISGSKPIHLQLFAFIDSSAFR